MTDSAPGQATLRQPRPGHPLEPASAAEFRSGRQILADAGLLTETTRFAYYGLDEPPKADVLDPAAVPDRSLRAFLIDVVTGRSADVVVSVGAGAVIGQRLLDPLADGQVPILGGVDGVPGPRAAGPDGGPPPVPGAGLGDGP